MFFTACEGDGDNPCRYDPVACTGLDTVFWTIQCNCNSNSGSLDDPFIMVCNWFDCPPPPQPLENFNNFFCPPSAQTGDKCNGGMPGSGDIQVCNYEPSGCVGRTDDGVFQKTCTCKENSGNRIFDCVTAGPPDCSPKPSFSCFSGDSLVEVKDAGFVAMRDIQIGDLVRTDTTSNSGKFEPIYSFGHYAPDLKDANMLRIHAADPNDPSTTASIEISPDHLMAIKGQGYVPASTVKVGDTVIHFTEDGGRNDVSKRVIDIEDIKAAGVFAPFTPSGTIIVNGFLASCFITLQPGQSHLFSIASFHSLAHAFELPHRLVCYYLSSCSDESYNTAGISSWVAKPLELVRWLWRV